jgi:hypothetical protein
MLDEFVQNVVDVNFLVYEDFTRTLSSALIAEPFAKVCRLLLLDS